MHSRSWWVTSGVAGWAVLLQMMTRREVDREMPPSPPRVPVTKSHDSFVKTLRDARTWQFLAMERVAREREARAEWDPKAESLETPAYHKQQLASDGHGYLGKAYATARQAAGKARSRDEKYQAALNMIGASVRR